MSRKHLQRGAGLAALILLVSSNQSRADIHCVKPGGGDGCTASITVALGAAVSGDTIRVSSGDYLENVVVEKNVTLEGGWNQSFTHRDPEALPTVLRPIVPEQSVVSIQGGAPTLEGFVITGGRAIDGGNHGGGLRIVDSNAFVRNNVIADNHAYLFGGGVWIQRGAPILEGNRIERNLSLGPGDTPLGGGVQVESSAAVLRYNVIRENTAGSDVGGEGGGISIVGGGPVMLLRNHILGNQADSEDFFASRGGGLAVVGAEAQLAENQIRDNEAARGGGLYNHADGVVSSRGDVLAGNRGFGLGGGGIFNQGSMELREAEVLSNEGSVGGGIYNTGALTILSGAVSDNRASNDGGGINSSDLAGTLTLTGTLVSNNVAGSAGGGIRGSTVSLLTNVTLSGNRSTSGGGLFQSGQIATLINATVTGNEAEEGGGLRGGANVALQNTIVAGNELENCNAAVVSNGYNLEDADSCGLDQGTDQVNTDPLLGELADNGGPTLTHALLAGSPAIDGGANAVCPSTDQRGLVRPGDGDRDGAADCDIGAYESGVVFAVNSTEDAVDADPDDGICETAPGSGICTLRAAVQQANALPGPDEILLPAGLYALTIPGADEDEGATGDLDVTEDLIVRGSGAAITIIDGGALDRVVHVGAGAASGIPVLLSHVTLQNGSAADFGGGVFNDGRLTLEQCIVKDNFGDDGGAFFAEGGSETTLIESIVSGNEAATSGGAINNNGSLRVIDSTLSGNTAVQFNGGAIFNNFSAVLSHATLDGNTAGDRGGAIRNGAKLFLDQSTLTENGAPEGGGLYNDDALWIRNTVLANDPGGNCGGLAAFSSLGHNAVTDASCDFGGPGDQTNALALLGPLGDHGGPTPTRALLPGSTAIDAGADFVCRDTDQRGFPRGTDGDFDGVARCDVGAYEFSALSLMLNETAFGFGDELRVWVSLDNPGVPATVDFYLGVILPDGDTIVQFTDLAGQLSMGRLSDPGSLTPIAPGVSLAAPFSFNAPDFFTYEWDGSEPDGQYLFYFAAVPVGAFADGSLDPGDILALWTVSFVFNAPV